ncbi:MAG: endonuclease/exonuclease/phosphatase family protein [Bacteroidales bacterium]|nr:endonuclease/exonuclease/phosphatase family protein [Bacteroidales bacterium]
MKRKRKLSILKKTLLLFNILAVVALLTIYAGTRISPQIFWPVALPGLFYPFILIINLGFFLLWAIRRKWYFLLSFIAIVAGFNHITALISFSNTSQELPDEGTNIHILSYNVKVFDLYNYGPRWQLSFTNRNNIFRFLEENDFDIICFQEFVHDKAGAFKTLDTLPTFLRAHHAHSGITVSSRNVNFFGMATFSAFPIVNKGRIEFPTRMSNLCIYTDLLIGKDTVRVYNVHFESIGLSAEDFLFVENMTNVEQIADRDYLRKGSMRIIGRLVNAYKQRAVQVKLVADHIEQCPYPVILAGDFNDTPHSYAYRIMTRKLNDAFKAGRGIGPTYIGDLPGFRIDYILYSNEFSAYNFKTGSQQYSDHYPISVWLNLGTER